MVAESLYTTEETPRASILVGSDGDAGDADQRHHGTGLPRVADAALEESNARNDGSGGLGLEQGRRVRAGVVHPWAEVSRACR